MSRICPGFFMSGICLVNNLNLHVRNWLAIFILCTKKLDKSWTWKIPDDKVNHFSGHFQDNFLKHWDIFVVIFRIFLLHRVNFNISDIMYGHHPFINDGLRYEWSYRKIVAGFICRVHMPVTRDFGTSI